MKILITGAFGQLGTAIYNNFTEDMEIIRTGRVVPKSETGIVLDIRDKIYLKECINAVSPEIILNLAAMTDVDSCELNPHIAKEINIAGVQHLCDSFDGKIIQLSTDYVFDGENGPYSECDNVNPISIYGKTKLASEKILMDKDPNHLIVRGNVIYDNTPNTQSSFLNWVVHSLENNKQIKVVDDQINNPIWAQSMAEILKLCIENNMSGIVHWGGADYLNRYEFSLKIAKKYELDEKLIEPIKTTDLKQAAPRPLNSGLKTDKLNELINVVPPTVDDCLKAIIKTTDT